MADFLREVSTNQGIRLWGAGTYHLKAGMKTFGRKVYAT